MYFPMLMSFTSASPPSLKSTRAVAREPRQAARCIGAFPECSALARTSTVPVAMSAARASSSSPTKYFCGMILPPPAMPFAAAARHASSSSPRSMGATSEDDDVVVFDVSTPPPLSSPPPFSGSVIVALATSRRALARFTRARAGQNDARRGSGRSVLPPRIRHCGASSSRKNIF